MHKSIKIVVVGVNCLDQSANWRKGTWYCQPA